MPTKKHFRPSPGVAIACLALLVSLGGVGYAAVRLPRNSVGSPQVINRSLRTVDLSRTSIASLRGQQGPTGPRGPEGRRGVTGPHGVTGPQGAPGPAARPFSWDYTFNSLGEGAHSVVIGDLGPFTVKLTCEWSEAVFARVTFNSQVAGRYQFDSVETTNDSGTAHVRTGGNTVFGDPATLDIVGGFIGSYSRRVIHAVLSGGGHGLDLDLGMFVDIRNGDSPKCGFDGVATYAP